MEVLLHHVSYADVYFHLEARAGGDVQRLRVHRERLERLARRVSIYLQENEVGRVVTRVYRGDTGEQDKLTSPGSPRVRYVASPDVNSSADSCSSAEDEEDGSPGAASRFQNASNITIGFDLRNMPPEKTPFLAEAFFDGNLEKAANYQLTGVVFPVIALGLDAWLESIVRRKGGSDFLKIYFLSGSHQRTKRAETFSTESAAKCLIHFAELQLKEHFPHLEKHRWRRESPECSHLEGTNIHLRRIHSGPGVFLYDENVRFMNNECLPWLDRDRTDCVRHFQDDSSREWSQEFCVSFILAEGAPARVSAITQSLHQFRPNYIHILRPKSYRDEDFLRADGVQVLPFH
ncbi:unnamed protein product, partial [Amoebophrya sp. A25]|eukprot:GSA25T00019157001.1